MALPFVGTMAIIWWTQVQYWPSVCCYEMHGTGIAYAAMQCMVLIWRMLLCDVRYWHSMCCYAMYRTGLAYGVDGTGLAYARCSSGPAYAALRCAVLT
eukprot:1548206-Rhodomonas_salina.3